MTTSWLFVFSLSVFALYNTVVGSLFGVPDSISDSYYTLRDYSCKAIFTVFCWAVALPLLIFWLEVAPGGQFLAFIACGGLMFVGASPEFKGRKVRQKSIKTSAEEFEDVGLEREVHKIAAVICLSSAYLWSILYSEQLIAWCFVILSVVVALFVKRTKTYWIEMLAFANTFFQLYLVKLLSI